MKIKLIVLFILPLLLGSLSSLFTIEAITSWYNYSNKPWFNPPNWIFGPVWTLLYLLMGLASCLVFKAEHTLKEKAMILYFIQLGLNFLWSFIFFYLKEPGWAFVEIILLWILINSTIIYFSKISRIAAYVMLPYVIWVSFAAILNYYHYILNA